MPARLTAHLPDGPAAMRWLGEDETCLIGRSRKADWVLPHGSISRRHARIEGSSEGWRLLDDASRNGSFVDGERVREHSLGDAHWLRFGDVHCEFRRCTDAEAASERSHRELRMAQSTALGERIASATGRTDLLQQTLQAVMALAECERSFLLYRDGDSLRVAETCGDASSDGGTALFTGSRSAIERALRDSAAVVINDTRRDLQLADSASVVSGGIRSLLALPLMQERETVAIIYADRRGTAQPITDFDLKLVLAFAERASVWIAARRGIEALQQMPLLGQISPAAA